MSEQKTLSTIEATRQQALDIALREEGSDRFDVVREAQAAQAQASKDALAEEQGPLERTARSVGAGFELYTGAMSVIDNIALRTSAALESDSFVGGLKAAAFLDPYKDENYNPRDPKIKSKIQSDIASRNLDPAGPDARGLATARSDLEYSVRLNSLDRKLKNTKHIQDSGIFTGTIPAFLGAMVDVDIAVGGGLYTKFKKANALKAAKNLDKLRTGKLDNIYDGALAGASSALIVEGTRATLDPLTSGEDILGAVAFSTIMGAGIGGMLPSQASSVVMDDVTNMSVASKIRKAVYSGRSKERQVQRDPDTPRTTPEGNLSLYERMQPVGDGSIGAAQVRDIQNPDIMMGEKSKEWIGFIEDELYLNDEYFEGIREFKNFVDPDAPLQSRVLQKTAERLYTGLHKIHPNLVPDYDRAMLSENPVLQWMGIKLLNSPLGQIANSRTAANLAQTMEDQVKSKYTVNYRDHYSAYATDKGFDFKNKYMYTTGHEQFGKDIQNLLAHRLKGDDVSVKAHPSVVAAADEIQDAYKTLFNMHKKHGTEGFEDVEWKDGHFKVIWSKERWLQAEHLPGMSTEKLVQAIKTAIIKATPDMSEDLAFDLATAIKRSATDFKTGSPVNAAMTINEDGRKLIEDVVRNTEYDGRRLTDDEVIKRVDAILYSNTEKGQSKVSRRRITMDYTTPIPGTDKTILDLIDPDVSGALDSSVRGQTSEMGRLAATDGLLQRRELPSLIQAVEDAARMAGKDPAADVKIAEDILSLFNEGAYGGGVSGVTNQLNILSRLSYLPQLGITQGAETGIMMSKSSLDGFQKAVGSTYKAMVKGMPDDVQDAVSASGKYLNPRELLGTQHSLDEVSFRDAPHLSKTIDNALHTAQDFMGSISFFYKMTEAQQRLSATINTNYLLNGIKKGTLSKKRLIAMNIDDDAVDLLNRYTDTVSRDVDGHITDINAENWDPEDLDRFRGLIAQQIDYDVQKTRKGQGHTPVHRNDLASIMMNMKGFAMNAFYSKALRNMRLADKQAAAEMVFNLNSSALAVAASAAVNGKLDRMDSEELARRAVNWSAHMSPLLMLTDPLAYVTGTDYAFEGNKQSPFQRYRYAQDGLIGLPAPLSAASQLAGVPRFLPDLLEDGEIDRSTLNSLKAIPVVGRMYGVPWALEEFYKSLKD